MVLIWLRTEVLITFCCGLVALISLRTEVLITFCCGLVALILLRTEVLITFRLIMRTEVLITFRFECFWWAEIGCDFRRYKHLSFSFWVVDDALFFCFWFDDAQSAEIDTLVIPEVSGHQVWEVVDELCRGFLSWTGLLGKLGYKFFVVHCRCKYQDARLSIIRTEVLITFRVSRRAEWVIYCLLFTLRHSLSDVLVSDFGV